MLSTRTALAGAAMWLLALGACSDYACSILEPERRIPDPPATSYDTATFKIEVQTHTEAIEGARVTPEFLRTTNVRPMLGRLLVDEDFKPGSTQVVLISHDWWRARFEGGPQVIGTTIQIDGKPAVIVGVAERSFRVPKQTNLWIPKRLP
jgi:putative ABC transport system permease protein